MEIEVRHVSRYRRFKLASRLPGFLVTAAGGLVIIGWCFLTAAARLYRVRRCVTVAG